MRIRSSSPSGRSMARAMATEASAIIVDGLPAHAGRPASVAISASWAASHRRLADVDRADARLGGDRRPADRAVVAGLAEHVDLVAAERLGRVQRGVGVADQRVEPEHVALAAGHAALSVTETTSLSGSRISVAADDPAQLLGERRGRVGVGLGQDDEELLAAVAAGEVDDADVGGQQLRDVAQDDVAGGMAVRVVEPLEVVEVDEDQRQRPAVAGARASSSSTRVEDGLAVGDAGQRVEGRLLPCLRRRGPRAPRTRRGRRRSRMPPRLRGSTSGCRRRRARAAQRSGRRRRFCSATMNSGETRGARPAPR